MGKIFIMEEKADKMVEKLEKMKECVEGIIECFTDSYQEYPEYPEMRHMPDEDWDDEYEVKRRRGNRQGSPSARTRMTHPHIGYTKY